MGGTGSTKWLRRVERPSWIGSGRQPGASSNSSDKLLVRKTSTLVEALSEITTGEVLRMEPLSPEGLRIVEELARKYDVSTQAVTALLQALISGHGTMAQFNHPELGGLGQWAQGGMTMIGDMFNNALKAKVDGLCTDLANLLRQEPSQATTSSQSQGQGGTGGSGNVSLFVPAAGGPPAAWWGADLGAASATGSQNDIRYAYFPASRRLTIAIGDHVTIYDTADHVISGVSQQQSGDASLSFVSQRGLVRVADLRVVSKK